jgi:hypothetical protein
MAKTTKSKPASNAKRVVKPLVATKPAMKSAPVPKAKSPTVNPLDRTTITAGARIIHHLFGPGVVLSVEGDVLEIAFEAGGVKRIVSAFVNRA